MYSLLCLLIVSLFLMEGAIPYSSPWEIILIRLKPIIIDGNAPLTFPIVWPNSCATGYCSKPLGAPSFCWGFMSNISKCIVRAIQLMKLTPSDCIYTFQCSLEVTHRILKSSIKDFLRSSFFVAFLSMRLMKHLRFQIVWIVETTILLKCSIEADELLPLSTILQRWVINTALYFPYRYQLSFERFPYAWIIANPLL